MQHYARPVTWALESNLDSWEPVLRALSFLAGLALLITAAMSIVRTMVIPRMTISLVYAIVLRSTDTLFATAARFMRTYRHRDRILAWSGPLGVIVALLVWLTLFLFAYALLIYGVTESTFSNALLQAGSGLLTLGLIGTPSEDVSAIDFIAAMTGPAVIALLIGFLPTLYQSYLARENRLLVSTAITGSPAWGPETLARVKLLEGGAQLPDIYLGWIPWCSQVRLTQTLYPALSRFRSPVGARNWLNSLVAVLDSAVIQLAIRTDAPDPQSVAFFEQGTQTILTISATETGIDSVVRFRSRTRRIQATLAVFGVTEGAPVTGDRSPLAMTDMPPGVGQVGRAITLDNLRGQVADQNAISTRFNSPLSTLPREEFDKALTYLRAAGIEIQRSDDEAFAIFGRLRGRYEAAAYDLAQRFYTPRAPWTGQRRPDTPVMYPTLAVDEKTT